MITGWLKGQFTHLLFTYILFYNVFIKSYRTIVNKKKEKFLKDLEESVDEVNLAIQGKVKLKSAEEILNEL